MRGLKIAISGKGGVGKSTIAATWSRLLAQRGFPVYAIDADPDANLAHALGMPPALAEKIRPLADNDALIEERTGAKRGMTGQLFSLTPDVCDIAHRYAVRFGGVQVLTLGTIRKGGGGCACPENVLLKTLVRYLVLHENQIVILDMEAGVEHLGRATAAGVDALVVVVEPGSRSIDTARHIRRLAEDIGIDKRMFLILNKLREGDRTAERAAAELRGIAQLGAIPFDERFIAADEKRASILDAPGTAALLSCFTTSLDALTAAVAPGRNAVKE